MNFSRALNVLILAFLGLNLFLVYHIYLPDLRLFAGSVTREEKQRLENNLQEYNYELNTELPSQTLKSSFLTVKPLHLDPSRLKQKYFRETEGVEALHREEANRVVYRCEQEGELIIYENGFYRFLVENKEGKEDTEEGSKETTVPEEEMHREKAREIAENFLKERGVKPQDAKYDIVKEYGPGNYGVVYYQKMPETNIPVYSQFIVEIKGQRVTKIESYWLNKLEYQKDREMEVIPVTAALVRLLEELGPGSRTRSIERVGLGYYNPVYDSRQEYRVEKWEIPPVWRVVMENGEVYYLNAFTGNLEEGIMRKE